MDPSPFFRNQVLRHETWEGLHRLLYLSEDKDEFWLIETKQAKALPYQLTLAELKGNFTPHVPARAPDAPSALKEPTKLQPMPRRALPSCVSVSERAWLAIQDLVADRTSTALFYADSRARILKENASAEGMPCYETQLKYLRWFWQGGQTQDALLGHFDKCGRPDVAGTANRGYHAQGRTVFQCSDQDYRNMRDVVENFYFDSKNPPSLPATYQHLREEHYKYQDGNGTLFLLPPGECPSQRQLKYFISRTWRREAVRRARKGDKHVDRNERATPNSAQDICHGIGHIYQLDASIVDVILASTNDPALLVGKPTIYLVVDHRSRMIVGWYVGFETASYVAATQAIVSIGEPKQKVCEELGLAYDKDDWLADGILPESFMADQGDLASKESRRICRSIRAGIKNNPGERPDLKGFVENGIHLIHTIIKPVAVAFSPDSENTQRRKVDHGKDGAYNLTEFKKLLVAAIIAYNRRPQRNLSLTPAMVKAHVKPVPREVWKYEAAARMGSLDRIQFEKVRDELMPTDKATLTGDGIRLRLRGKDGRRKEGFDLFYSCPEALEKGWLFSGRNRACEVDIAFEYHCVNEIVVFSPDSRDSCVAKLTGDSKRLFMNMSQAEVLCYFYDRQLLIDEAEEDGRQAQFVFNQTAQVINSIAVPRRNAAVAASGLRSGATRSKNIKATRSGELLQERRHRAAKGRALGSPVPSPGPTLGVDGPGEPAGSSVRPSPSACTDVPAGSPSSGLHSGGGLKQRLLEERAASRPRTSDGGTVP